MQDMKECSEEKRRGRKRRLNKLVKARQGNTKIGKIRQDKTR